jgi:hypothetical protein
MRRAIAACLRYAEKQMEPDVNISIKPHSQTGHLIALRDRRARAIARNARVAKALTLAA